MLREEAKGSSFQLPYFRCRRSVAAINGCELNSERIHRCVRRGSRASKKEKVSLTIGDSPQRVAGSFNCLKKLLAL
jgi:hypothetical protein